VDLPTYTSIWRIEKRLYKLYDFRLPMPLPIGQVAVFAAVAVPYVVVLTVLGLPFNHTLIWLYVLPPGVATWLVTRPVLESKRLPELIKSQLRYLSEPRVLCRMAPLAERDIVLVTARVWRPRVVLVGRQSAEDRAQTPIAAADRDMQVHAPPVSSRASLPREPLPPGRSRDSARAAPPLLGQPAASRSSGRAGAVQHVSRTEIRLVASGKPAAARTSASDQPVSTEQKQPVSEPTFSDRSVSDSAVSEPSVSVCDVSEQQARETVARPGPPRPAVTVVGAAAKTAPPSVERALAGPAARRGNLRPGRVSVVPGGHRPGKPDLIQRDRARAQLSIGIKPRVVVLGCTVGAGQTMTTLLTGEVLASVRSDQVAVMDLNPGPGSLAKRSEARPAPSQAALTGRSRLVVIGPRGQGSEERGNRGGGGPRDPAADTITFEATTERYDLVLADPATVAVPKLLAVADQLILVAPASAAAPGAIAMTFEWLEAHGQAGLAADSIMVLNGVSRRSVASIDQAERVCAGRCRAIIKIPWDDQLQGQVPRRVLPAGPSAQLRQHWTGVLSPATAAAYTALAGVLVASLSAEYDGLDDPVPAGQAPR
jgi:MinD-like ATPase involved in chromosome partitioning or flagellar assembly